MIFHLELEIPRHLKSIIYNILRKTLCGMSDFITHFNNISPERRLTNYFVKEWSGNGNNIPSIIPFHHI